MASREVKALGGFYSMLASDPARAFYGPGHVVAAAELGAIQTLLITDSIFRVNNVAKRRKVTKLVEGVCAREIRRLMDALCHVDLVLP